MSKVYIKQYKPCQGALDLARGLNGQRIKCVGSTYRYQPDHIVINWGFAGSFDGRITYNQPAGVRNASDKRRAFKCFDDARVPTLLWTIDQGRAQELSRHGKRIYGRTPSGMAGSGIVVYEPYSTVGSHELYTVGFNTHREFRIHVVGGKAVHTMEKKRIRNYDGEPDPLVRSHRRGWVFCINDLDPIPPSVQSTAIAAVEALGLDFGGVDIGMDRAHNVVVFEVNTAPGLEGSTIPAYINRFKEMINESENRPDVGEGITVRQVHTDERPTRPNGGWSGIERRVSGGRRSQDQEVGRAIAILLSGGLVSGIQRNPGRQEGSRPSTPLQ